MECSPVSRIDLSAPARPKRETDSIASGIRRIALAVLGVALIVSSFGVWIMQSAYTPPELSLMKLGLSLLMLIAGLCFYVSARQVRPR